MENFKDLLSNYFEQWTQEIKSEPHGFKVYDISKVFVELMARNIISITLGEDIINERIDLPCRENSTGNSFVVKSLKIHEAIVECFEQLLSTGITKTINPLIIFGLIDHSYDVTPY